MANKEIENIRTSVDYWLSELEGFDFECLCMKPSVNSWSLGQVCMHLIDETQYYLAQAKICSTMNDNADKTASALAEEMFHNNSFPDEIIEGPPTNAKTCQPESKEQLLASFAKLKEQTNELEAMISTDNSKGKTAHPGLGYFDAYQWIQFADMHLRHHLRQKQRIEEILERR